MLVATALELLDKLYVHLPSKRSMYAVNPLQRLRLLRRRLAGADPRLQSDRAFYNEVLSIFAQLRDLHTVFVLPEPLRSAIAFLPFRLELCLENGERQYVVSQVLDSVGVSTFSSGATVTHWNGTPIDRAVALNAERESGSNAAARQAQGLNAMTLRWLGQSLPPDEEWVTVRYLSESGAPAEARFEWQVFQQDSSQSRERTIARAQGHGRRCLGLDNRGEVERQIRRFLFGGKQMRGPGRRAFPGEGPESTMPDVFSSSRNVQTRWGTFAYVRIATFNVQDDGQFLTEFIRLTSLLSQDGLILDVRGNTGGLINAGERLLQLLTPKRIEPCRFHFVNSPRTQSLAETHTFLSAWKESIGQAVETGTDYSLGFPLLSIDQYNDVGQTYQGPVVLVTDALCYSTTDIFAAGFQDHEIGLILGVDESTGAGGANVWEYPLIASLCADALTPLTLPGDASLRVAVRRVTRVGRHAGMPLEDFGVSPDHFHALTRRDILDRNVDLIDHAAQILSTMPRQRLSASMRGSDVIRVDCRNVDRVDVAIDGRPVCSSRASSKPVFDVKLPRRSTAGARQLELNGYRKGTLVAATRVLKS